MGDFSPIRLNILVQMDVIICRKKSREIAIASGFGLADQTRLATAVSELARNALEYGGGGTFLIMPCEKDGYTGVCVVIEDSGPGIADIESAMSDGFSTNGGLGGGLGGAQRLMDEFEIESEFGTGTRIVARKWLATSPQ